MADQGETKHKASGRFETEGTGDFGKMLEEQFRDVELALYGATMGRSELQEERDRILATYKKAVGGLLEAHKGVNGFLGRTKEEKTKGVLKEQLPLYEGVLERARERVARAREVMDQRGTELARKIKSLTGVNLEDRSTIQKPIYVWVADQRSKGLGEDVISRVLDLYRQWHELDEEFRRAEGDVRWIGEGIEAVKSGQLTLEQSRLDRWVDKGE